MMKATADPQTPRRHCARCFRATSITIDGHLAGRKAVLCPECHADRHQAPVVITPGLREVPEQFR